MKAYLLAALLAFAAPLSAHEFKAGDLVVGHPYAFATLPSAKAGAGYFTIANAGSEPDRLLAVETPFPMTMLHTTEVAADGTARMVHLDAVEIPAGGEVVFEPGGLHVMFMGLSGPIEEGASIPATLTFERAGAVEVEFVVERRGESDGHADH